MRLRSEEWFQGAPDNTFQHRSALRTIGHLPENYIGKPIIGIANSWSDFNNCNMPHKELVEWVKKGVIMAGGYPMEFHTITTPADLMKPSDLVYRNLMAMDVEEMVRSQPIDGLVLLAECDKTTPAQLMAAASCNIPAIQLAAGHRSSGTFRGETVTYATDLWKYLDEYKAGLLKQQEWDELEGCMSCSAGGCAVMGSASTIKCMSEMLGMMLPGTACIPAVDSRRVEAAIATGKRIVEMVQQDLRPSDLMTPSAFHNAFKLLAALGGSTNAIIHLTAIAGRRGIHLDLAQIQTLMQDIPLIVNLQPSGSFNMDAYYQAGGLPATIRQLLPLLESACLGATGETIAKIYGEETVKIPGVITSIDEPVQAAPTLVMLQGNIAPNGAIIKKSASSEQLLKHRGKAVTFHSYEDMLERIDSDELEVDETSILVMKNCGPVGEGMPEWGSIPIPRKLLKQGIKDLVRISDARMSGTSYGTVVLHIAPEAAIGGPLAIVEDGDMIELDVLQGSIQLIVEDAVILQRLQHWRRPVPRHHRGYPRLYADHVLQAPEGCDFDFLRPQSVNELPFVEPIIGRG
ncbi:dihydroxy-acid dehydratase [Paenibacillus baekrokdamisoli]|uniref:Dihydroxy-acid dehydratase n=1 Tax=Paenibacillus baekrokdamisoli TaxID=1712516 RepID=A0A3G9IPQ2_9BACL|nr:dihydroxy-acid dehydratase [Paenibacillus baekrokdamisoli]MBB3073448.1 dihydroxy-acid dehydratase [Paenibacillus baekrokdamisoli]BBH20242.1 dihydroxy-acid dehydratase [Paenibacillus baekrokdamisoli]